MNRRLFNCASHFIVFLLCYGKFIKCVLFNLFSHPPSVCVSLRHDQENNKVCQDCFLNRICYCFDSTAEEESQELDNFVEIILINNIPVISTAGEDLFLLSIWRVFFQNFGSQKEIAYFFCDDCNFGEFIFPRWTSRKFHFCILNLCKYCVLSFIFLFLFLSGHRFLMCFFFWLCPLFLILHIFINWRRETHVVHFLHLAFVFNVMQLFYVFILILSLL